MKWILIISGILVGLVAIVWGVGAMLPEQHVATCSAKYTTSPEEVCHAIMDFAAMPTWREELHSMARLPDRNGHPVWKETSDFGAITYEVTGAEDDTLCRMETTIIDKELPFGGKWTYQLSFAEDGTNLTITEEGKIYSPFFRFMARFIFGYHSTMEVYLKALGQKFGEETKVIST